MPDLPKLVKRLSNPFMLRRSKDHEIPPPIIPPSHDEVTHTIFCQSTSTASCGDLTRFDAKNYSVVTKLGKGTFGRVNLVRSEGSLFALKQQKTRQTCFGDEIDVHVKISKNGDHDNIVKLFYASGNTHKTGLIAMEYCNGVSLMSLLTLLNEGQLRIITRQLMSALAFLHSINIVHRDIKPENVMISRDGQVKIIDFGVAADADVSAPNTPSGTLLYMAPEQVACMERPFTYGTRVDVWAAGVSLIEAATGRVPHSDDSKHAIAQAIHRGDAPSLAKAQRECKSTVNFSTEFHNFISACLKREPDRRYSAAAALADPWLCAEDLAEDRERLIATVNGRLTRRDSKGHVTKH